MALSALRLASRRLLQARPGSSPSALIARPSSSGSSGPGYKPRPYLATINGKVLYIVLPFLVIGLFTVLPCYRLEEIGPMDRFNWETNKKKEK